MFDVSTPIKGYEGFLFIRDLHLASGKMGRRIDDYSAAGVRKLDQARCISHERRLFPVSLGDLFHRPGEKDLPLLSKVMTVLAGFPEKPPVVAGSHDRIETRSTDRDAVHLLANAGVIRLLEEPGEVLTLDVGRGQYVRLWVVPAGCRIPEALPPAPRPNTTTVLVCHHDIAFQGPFPGAHELHEIANCDLLVNGHMHTPAPMVVMGRTAWHNPGASMRPSVDLRDMRPGVSVWTPAHGITLENVELDHTKDVFDLTGKEVGAADPRMLKGELPKGLRLSSFAAMLRKGPGAGTASSLDAARSDDGAMLVEELDGYFKLFDKPDNLKRYLSGLLQEVIAERAPA